MNKKILASLAFVICIAFTQIANAEPEFSFKFGDTGNGNTEFNNPTDVILDINSKNIYVVDNNNNRINVFDDDGDYYFQYGSFCDMAAVQNCNSNTDGANENGDGQFNNPLSIAIDALGKFYVVDSGNERIQVFDDDGEFQSKFGSSDSGDDEYLGSANSIVIQDGTRKIFVSDTERDSISIFDSSENFVTSFDSFNGNDDFQNPTGLIIDNGNDMLYVVDSGNDRIIVFELVTGTTCPSGTVESVDGICYVKEFGTTGSDEGEFDDPTGLAFDETNDLLYVSDTDNNRIQIFNIIGGTTCPGTTQEIVDGVCFVDEFGSVGFNNGEFDSPMGIAFDAVNALLFVADSDNDRIQAFNVDVEPPSLVPAPPVNIDAAPVSATSIILTWDKPDLAQGVPEITGYKIEYKTGTGNYIVITQNTGSKSTSFIHKGLSSENTYSYRVYAINSEGTSASSSIVSEKPKHTTTPAAVTATAISPTQIKLSWLPPSETFGQTISGYEIKREVISGVYDTIGNVDDDITTFVVSNLQTDKTYSFAVSALIGYGTTQESESASATPRDDSVDTTEEPMTSTEVEITKSTPPIKLTATVVSATQINLAWSPPVDNGNSEITGYKIQVKKDEVDFTTLVADSESTTRTFSHKNLTTNSKYTYKVFAINAAGTSDASNEFSATPKANNVQISPMGKLTIDEGKLVSFSVKLVDTSVKDVVFSLERNPEGSKIISNTGMFSWTPTASDGGKTFVFDVIAKKDGNTDKKEITITVNDVMDSPVTEPEDEPTVLGLAPFVDEIKDPQHYVDRYNNEKTYKDWFDKTYPEYESIYQAVGLEEPLEIPAPFVDEIKDPQHYVDRYNNEKTYKDWFDKTYPEYESIYQAVGLEEPTIEEPKQKEKKFGICGPGTKLIDGVCTVIKKPVVKPWWQFW
ncbi:fibronectin type III domain-containing protein [Nitrosopumilus sp. S4]